MRTWLRIAWVLLGLIVGVSAGCDSTAAGGTASPPPSLELGAGELAFEALRDGASLPYVAGSQGGYHVFVSFRTHGLDPARVLVSVTTAVEHDPALVLTRTGRVNFRPDVSAAVAADGGDAASRDASQPNATAALGSATYAGWPAQILYAPCHVGAHTRIDVTLTDLADRSVQASKTVVIAMGAPTMLSCKAAP